MNRNYVIQLAVATATIMVWLTAMQIFNILKMLFK